MAEPRTLSKAELNRSTLARQLLLKRETEAGMMEILRRLVALQSQEPPSPYLALWSRQAGFDPHELDAAFREQRVVRSNMVRMTLHTAHADDYVPFREAMEPTLRSRLGDRRFTASGLTPTDADELIPQLLEFAEQPQTVASFERWLAERLPEGADARGAWWGLKLYAPLLRATNEDTWSFGRRSSYVAAGHSPLLADPRKADESLVTLVERYLEGFGPASVADVAQFAMVQRYRVKAAVRALGDRLKRLRGPKGEELLDVLDGRIPDGTTPAPPRLLPMWDNVLFAYHDRSRIIPVEYRKLVIRVNGDSLPTLLVDGQVAGVWRPVDGGIEATAFHALSQRVWDALAAEAAQLTAFLALRDPGVYSRYGHWWEKLPAAERRLLPDD